MAAAIQETPFNWADFMRCYLIERILSSFDISADVVRFVAACVLKCGTPTDTTRRVIDRMLKSASVIRSSGHRAGALSAIAAFLFQAGYVEEAKSVVQQALGDTASLKNIQEKSETLSTIVLDIATTRDMDRARDVARHALAIAQSNNYSWSKAISVSEVACALRKIGDDTLAKEAFSIALNAAWDVHDIDDRAYALCAVAGAMERAGDKTAQNVFRDAVSQFGTAMPPEEIEDEFHAIYFDYQVRSGRDLDSLFQTALELKGRKAALRSLAERLAKLVVDGDYPHGSHSERNIDRLCDRKVFLRLADEEAAICASGEPTLTLRALFEALLEDTAPARDGIPR
jgi:hypothetical protein